MAEENTKFHCSICQRDKEKAEMGLYVKATNTYVCSNCLSAISIRDQEDIERRIALQELANQIQGKTETETNFSVKWHFKDIIKKNTPQKIKKYLDNYIIGQEEAKKTLSVAIYNHYKRLVFTMNIREMKERNKSIPEGIPTTIDKSNILMIGPTGVGKTYILKTLADFLGVPFAITDATSLTESGYVGSDPEVCIQKLWQAAGQDVAKTETGIVFLDEFDKLARKSETSRMTTSDPGREGVQQALLKIIEGTVVTFNEKGGRKNPQAPMVSIDTSNILFICGGAFEGIEKIIERRVSKQNGFGVTASNFGKENVGMEKEEERYNKLIGLTKAEDIQKYGIISELTGRLPVLVKLRQLTEKQLIQILSEPKNAILKQYGMMLRMDGGILRTENKALKTIARKALDTKTGARALRNIVENTLLDTMYELPEIAKKAPYGSKAFVIIESPDEEELTVKIEYQKEKQQEE